MAVTIDGAGPIAGLTSIASPTTLNGLTIPTTGFGKVLQVVQTTAGTRQQITSASFVDINPSLSITPSSVTSKVFVMASYSAGVYRSSSGAGIISAQLVRGATSFALFSDFLSLSAASQSGEIRSAAQNSFIYLDSPATTSATTYKIQMRLDLGTRLETPYNFAGNALNVLTLWEIAA